MKNKKFDTDHALLLAMLRAFAVHFPKPLPDADRALTALAGGDRERMMFHVMYLRAHKFIKADIVELFPAPTTRSEDVLNPARLSWTPEPVLTEKGLNAHLGVIPVVW